MLYNSDHLHTHKKKNYFGTKKREGEKKIKHIYQHRILQTIFVKKKKKKIKKITIQIKLASPRAW